MESAISSSAEYRNGMGSLPKKRSVRWSITRGAIEGSRELLLLLKARWLRR